MLPNIFVNVHSILRCAKSLFTPQDSPPGSTENMALSTFAVKNPRAKIGFADTPPKAEQEDLEEDDFDQPLLHKSEGGPNEEGGGVKVDDSAQPLLHKSGGGPNEEGGGVKVGNGEVSNRDSMEAELQDDTMEPEEALLTKAASVDSYDLEKNPFFADS